MIKNKKFVFFILGMLSLITSEMQVQGRPAPEPRSANHLALCLDFCDKDSGPVCGIDASGVLRTFQNHCLAKLAYCREGNYYAVIKEGEC